MDQLTKALDTVKVQSQTLSHKSFLQAKGSPSTIGVRVYAERLQFMN